jgi:hypothetical protein
MRECYNWGLLRVPVNTGSAGFCTLGGGGHGVSTLGGLSGFGTWGVAVTGTLGGFAGQSALGGLFFGETNVAGTGVSAAWPRRVAICTSEVFVASPYSRKGLFVGGCQRIVIMSDAACFK